MILIDASKEQKTAAAALPVGTRIRLRKNVIRPGSFYLAGTTATMSGSNPPCATTDKGQQICWSFPSEAEAWEKFWSDAEAAPAQAPQKGQPKEMPKPSPSLPAKGTEVIFVRDVTRPNLLLRSGQRATISQSSPGMMCAITPPPGNAEICWVFDKYEEFWKDVVLMPKGGASLIMALDKMSGNEKAWSQEVATLLSAAGADEIAAVRKRVVAACDFIVGLRDRKMLELLGQNPHLLSILLQDSPSAAAGLAEYVQYGKMPVQEVSEYIDLLIKKRNPSDVMLVVGRSLSPAQAKPLALYFYPVADLVAYQIVEYSEDQAGSEPFMLLNKLGLGYLLPGAIKKQILRNGISWISKGTVEDWLARHHVVMSDQELEKAFYETMLRASPQTIQAMMKNPTPPKVNAMAKVVKDPAKARVWSDYARRSLEGVALKDDAWMNAPELDNARVAIIKSYLLGDPYGLLRMRPGTTLEELASSHGIELSEQELSEAYRDAFAKIIAEDPGADGMITAILDSATQTAREEFSKVLEKMESSLVGLVSQFLSQEKPLPAWTRHPLAKNSFDDILAQIVNPSSVLFRSVFSAAAAFGGIKNVEGVMGAAGVAVTDEQVVSIYQGMFEQSIDKATMGRVNKFMDESPPPAATRAMMLVIQSGSGKMASILVNGALDRNIDMPQWVTSGEFAEMLGPKIRESLLDGKSLASRLGLYSHSETQAPTVEAMAAKLNIKLSEEETRSAYKNALRGVGENLNRSHIVNCAMSDIGSEALKEEVSATAPEQYYFLRPDMSSDKMAKQFIEDWVYGSRYLGCQVVNSMSTKILPGSEKTELYFPPHDYPQGFNEGRLAGVIHPVAREKISMFVKDVYDRTQAELPKSVKLDQGATVGSGTVRLYRGVFNRVNVPSVMESWTSSKGTASGSFDGWDVLEADVPFEAIFVMYKSPDWKTTSHLSEHEYIVLNNRLPFRSVRFPGQSKRKGRDWHPWDEFVGEGL